MATPWKLRARAPLLSLVPSPHNPRHITQDALHGLALGLAEFGQVQDVVVNKRNNRIVGGHQRVAALLSLGDTECDVTWVDLDDTAEKALCLLLNNPHTQGTWDQSSLDRLLADVSASLPASLFGGLRLDLLTAPPPVSPVVTEPAPVVQHTVPARAPTEAPRPWSVVVGDSRAALRGLPDNSLDACVTDPPYELGFMGQGWDRSGIAFDVGLWREVFRVLKPGAHAVVFGATRTVHRVAVALEDAGFELRDMGAWLFGTGFPKSLDVSKALDNAAGAVRPVVGTKLGLPGYHLSGHQGGHALGHGLSSSTPETRAAAARVTAPVSEAAVQWEGWGTALKPAMEPILLVRKPLVGTVAENVQAHGTGGIHINATRGDDGRWPSGVVLDPAALELLPENARRFFYCPKVSRGEREAGLDALPAVSGAAAVGRKKGSAGAASPRAGSGRTAERVRNIHPTVKPVDLMRWWVALVCPPGGTVLDPFAGSGSTGIGCLLAGAEFLGVELETPHACIAWHRLTWWAEHAAEWVTAAP